MKNEMILYRSDDSEQLLIDASQRALEKLGIYGGSTHVEASYALLTTLSDAVKRSNLILVLITKSEYIKMKKIISKSLGIEIVRNATISKKLGRLADDKEFKLHDSFPKGSVALESKDGLYSGYYLKSGNQCIVFSPLDTARTEGILEKAGIKLDIECSCIRKLRFVGVAKAQLEQAMKEIDGVKSYGIDDLRGELELVVETMGQSKEIAYERSDYVISKLKKAYKSRLYGVDSHVLPSLVMSALESERNQLAIADTENSSFLVAYLAVDSRAGEWCKKIRGSSSYSVAGTQDEVSDLAKKVRNKSGFELSVVFGDECFDEERSKDYVYCAFANEQGVMTKRFWKRDDECSADFRTRCAKELVLLLHNDRIGDGEYGYTGKNIHRAKMILQDKQLKARSIGSGDVSVTKKTSASERKSTISAKADRSAMRIKYLIMLVLVVIAVIAIAVLVGGRDSATEPTVNNGGEGTTAAITTTLPSDM